MKIERKTLKILIETSRSVDEADRILREYTSFETTAERIAFLKGLFGCKISEQPKNTPKEDIYRMMLKAIIKIRV